MPRSNQSREAGIIAYFQSADLSIAEVVMGLAKAALGARLAKSAAAKATATKAAKPAKPTAPKPTAVATPAAAPKKTKKRRKRASRAKSTADRPPTAAQIEQEVAAGDGAVIE